MRNATRSYRSYSSLVKLLPLVPEFAVKDLPLDRTDILVPEFVMKDLPLGRTHDDDKLIFLGDLLAY